MKLMNCQKMKIFLRSETLTVLLFKYHAYDYGRRSFIDVILRQHKNLDLNLNFEDLELSVMLFSFMNVLAKK